MALNRSFSFTEAPDESTRLNQTDQESRCPSLYTLIQLLCVLSSTAILIGCIASTMWIEHFFYTGKSEYRYISIGLWSVCYYENISLPSTATHCFHIKFKDFTLSVQICQIIGLVSSCASALLFAWRIIFSCLRKPCCVKGDLSYELRKYRIITHLITILSFAVSLPLFIMEAHLEGVRLHPINKRQSENTRVHNSVTYSSNYNVTRNVTNGVMKAKPEAPNRYSVFSWGLWMEFASLALVIIAFTMALIKHTKKRRIKNIEASLQSGRRASVDFSRRSNKIIEMKSSRPRSESQRVLFSRQGSIPEMATSP